MGPLDGPVIVFGPNNFPLAFNGVSGGDMVAAIAAGNPVIAKGHPSHPRTTQLLAEAALEAIEATDVPQAMVQLFYHTSNENGTKLVSHPITGATGFTGSRTGGMALKAAADAAGKPIYLEMSSVNPIVILPGTLDERSDDMAQELFASCTLGSGQFCTNPGLVLMLDTPQNRGFHKTGGKPVRGQRPRPAAERGHHRQLEAGHPDLGAKRRDARHGWASPYQKAAIASRIRCTPLMARPSCSIPNPCKRRLSVRPR